MKKIQGYSITLELRKNFKSLGGWVEKPAMADATKTTACLIGHMTYTQAPTACEKNTFHLFHFTQQVKNYSSIFSMREKTVYTRVLSD